VLYDLLYRYVVLPMVEQLNHRNLLDDIESFRSQLELPSKSLLEEQTSRLREIVVHAATSCLFWRERFAKAGIDPHRVESVDDLRNLPVLEKMEVRAHLEEMRSQGVPDEKTRLAMTGGSTVAPMKFYRDIDMLRARTTWDWVFYDWIGRKPYDRWAFVWGAMQDLGAAGALKTRLRNRLLNRVIVLPGNRMDEVSIRQFVAEMCRFKPRFLHSYSQAAYLLAKKVKEQSLAVPKMEAITVTAEPISPKQKQEIREVFRCPVYSFYGAREFGMMAAERPGREGLQINPLNAIIEFLRPDGSRAEVGVPGQVVVTDLLNRAVPFIRYRLGDIAIPLPAASAGPSLPRMDLCAGRETDFVLTPEGRFVSGAAMTLIASPGVAGTQYLQTESAKLTVRYVKAPGFTADHLSQLQEQLVSVLGVGMRYDFVEVSELPLLASGKLQYVYSQVAREALAITTEGSDCQTDGSGNVLGLDRRDSPARNIP